MGKIGEKRVLLLKADGFRRHASIRWLVEASAHDCRCWPRLSLWYKPIPRLSRCPGARDAGAEVHDGPMGGSITIAEGASSAVACEEGEAACRVICMVWDAPGGVDSLHRRSCCTASLSRPLRGTAICSLTVTSQTVSPAGLQQAKPSSSLACMPRMGEASPSRLECSSDCLLRPLSCAFQSTSLTQNCLHRLSCLYHPSLTVILPSTTSTSIFSWPLWRSPSSPSCRHVAPVKA
jgi:hypothetical protein